MKILKRIYIGLFLFIAIVVIAMILFTIPAMLSLPSGIRPGLEALTIEQAAERLSRTGLDGWELIGEAKMLVEERMAYCRRNNWQHYSRAFYRGYGFCQQKAYALANLLQQLGFNAYPVYTMRARFESGTSGHSWVRVSFQGETRDIDPQFQDPITGELLFTTLCPVKEFTPAFRIFSGWGSAAVNAFVYYRSGKDWE